MENISNVLENFHVFVSKGNYTCRASNTEPASIYVYVSKGKKSEK